MSPSQVHIYNDASGRLTIDPTVLLVNNAAPATSNTSAGAVSLMGRFKTNSVTVAASFLGRLTGMRKGERLCILHYTGSQSYAADPNLYYTADPSKFQIARATIL